MHLGHLPACLYHLHTCTSCVSPPPKSSVVPPATQRPPQHMSLSDTCQHETNTHTCPIHPHTEQLLTTSGTHHSPLRAEKAFKVLPYTHPSRLKPPASLFSQPEKVQMCNSSPCNPAGPYEAFLEQAFPHILCRSSPLKDPDSSIGCKFSKLFCICENPHQIENVKYLTTISTQPQASWNLRTDLANLCDTTL